MLLSFDFSMLKLVINFTLESNEASSQADVAMCPLISLFRREENRDGDTYVPYPLHSYRSTAMPFIFCKCSSNIKIDSKLVSRVETQYRLFRMEMSKRPLIIPWISEFAMREAPRLGGFRVYDVCTNGERGVKKCRNFVDKQHIL